MYSPTVNTIFREYLLYKGVFSEPLSKARSRLLFVALLVVGLTVTNTLLIWLMARPFDYLAKGQYDELVESLALVAAVVVVNQGFHMFNTYLANKLGLQLVGRIRNLLVDRLLSGSSFIVSRYSHGDILARISHDVDRVQNMLIEQPLFLLSHVLTLVFYSIMLIVIDWKLALIALALVPLFLFQQRIFAARKRKAAGEFLNKNGRLLATEEEILSRIQGITTLNAGPQVVRKHADSFSRAVFWAIKERWLDALFHATLALLIYGSGLLIVYFGVDGVMSGTHSIGSLMSFLLYLGYLSVPIRGIAQIPFQWQSDVTAARRIEEIWNAEPIVKQIPDAQPLQITRASIDFDKVSFSYDGKNDLLSNVSVHIPGGKTVALVGPSGSGKSTLIKLLVRFFDVSNGSIQIDGQDIRGVDFDSLRKNIAVVWQQPVLFRDSIRANLRLANESATDEQLWAVLQQAQIAEFVREQPSGLDSVIGEIELSAGQQQRLSIAQAYLRDAPILVMDEASSALDSHTEEKIVTALESLRKGRTTLLIAHRYSSIRKADFVIYLNGDGSCTVGTHDELLKTHAGYQSAVRWQTGEA